MRRIALVGLLLSAAAMIAPNVARADTASAFEAPPPAATHVTRTPFTAIRDSVAVLRIVERAPSLVRSIDTATHTTVAVKAANLSVSQRARTPLSRNSLFGIGFVGMALMGTLASIPQDKNTSFSLDTVRAQYNLLAKDYFYSDRNYIAGGPPAIAIATNTTGLKTVGATVMVVAGIPKSMAAADPAFTLTGGVLAISSFRKYRLLWNGAATSVQASTDAATAAACAFTSKPVDGTTIVGMVTVATSNAVTFTPGTTALNAAGITATIQDGTDSSEILASLVTP